MQISDRRNELSPPGPRSVIPNLPLCFQRLWNLPTPMVPPRPGGFARATPASQFFARLDYFPFDGSLIHFQ